MWEVHPEESGSKLIAFLQKKLPSTYSARQIKKGIENNRCEVNGKVERFASRSLKSGDRISFRENGLENRLKATVHFEANRVLFEDDYFLIYDKPAGIPSDSPLFLKALHQYCKELNLVHRLDKETSGTLILAKSAAAKEAMILLFRDFAIEKSYLTIVDGVPKDPRGKIENFLGVKFHYQGQKIWGAVKENGLQAITYWQRLEVVPSYALLLCQPKTGRTHQIRVHLSEMGYPILGDYQYGQKSKSTYHPLRCLLHALSVSFIHPFTQKPIKISSSLPSDMATAIMELFGKPYEQIFNC